MAYIFMDESGCLGFDFEKQGTSRYFVISFLFSTHKRRFDKIVQKTFQSMPPQIRQSHSGVLHSYREKPVVRMKVLQALSNKETASIMVVRLNKKRVYAQLRDEKSVLYNYVTNLLLDRVLHRKLVPLDDPLHLIASQRETNRFLNENFQAYLRYRVSQNHTVPLKIQIIPPHGEKGLQIADFVSWAVFRNYERGDSTYYDVIRKKNYRRLSSV